MLLLILALLAQDPAIEGTWHGRLKAGAQDLRIILHLSKQADGSFTGTLDSPDQGGWGLELDDVRLKGDKLTFRMKNLPASFAGDLKDARLVGTWTQSGASMPLAFGREAPPAPRRPQEPKKPYPYDEEEVAYENPKAKSRLAGTLTRPRAPGPHPAVLLISGSGQQDRDEALAGHRPFLVLADHLTRAGLAVLRVDDRGVGKSTGNPSRCTSEDFADDVLAGVAYLRTRQDIGTIGLAGHSEGGLIAPMVAAKSEHVAFVVLMAGPGVTGEEILLAQSALIARAMGAGDEAVERARDMNKRIYAVVREERNDEAAKEKILDIAGPAIGPQLKSLLSPWFRFFIAYDPAPTLAKVKCPVLAVNGELDLQVPCRANLDAIKKACAHAETVAFPKLNHLFQTCETGAPTEYASIEETFAPAALKTISDWVLKRTERRP